MSDVSHAISARSSTVKNGSLEIDLESKRVTASGKRIHLTNKEYQILEFLMVSLGQVITKEMFLDRLYNGICEPEMKIIDIFICKLRKKLSSAMGGESVIETVWGRGYVIRRV